MPNVYRGVLMRKLIILVFLIFVIAPVSAWNTYSIDSSNMEFLVEESIPQPVEPGQDLTIKVGIKNTGGSTAEDVHLEFKERHPFYLKSESKNFTKKDICSGCSKDNTYYLQIADNATSGTYPVKFEIVIGDKDNIKISKKVFIKIVGIPDMVLDYPQTRKVIPGGNFTMNLNLINKGTGSAKNIKIIPKAEKIFSSGANVRFIEKMETNKKRAEEIDFLVKDDIRKGPYKFPIFITYQDELGKKYNSTYNLGILILEESNINLQRLTISPSFPKVSEVINIEGMIENTATGDAKDVVVKLSNEDKTSKAFLGEVKAGDDSPFYFDVKHETEKNKNYTLEIFYHDDLGKHILEKKLDIKASSKDTTFVFLLLIVVGVGTIGYLFYKRELNEKE